MGTTKRIPSQQWRRYFDEFTRQHVLENEVPKAASIEVISLALGLQREASTVRLLGLAYDPHTNDFNVLLEDLDHSVSCPVEIWVIEEEGGFISTLELVCPDGRKEIIHLWRSGPPARRYPLPLPLRDPW